MGAQMTRVAMTDSANCLWHDCANYQAAQINEKLMHVKYDAALLKIR